MNKTPIEWVKNPDGTQGYTWNPITGCLNGCPYCYARKLANGRLKQRYLANKNLAPFQPMLLDYYNEPASQMAISKSFADPFYPRFWEDRLWTLGINHTHNACQKSKGIFVCDMSDLFGIGIPDEWTRKILDSIKGITEHRFYLLTKQPQNLAKWNPFEENCWVGVTVTADGDMTKAYYGLAQIEAKVKYVSCEPLLGAITMKSHRILKEVDWLIIGAQTKPTVMPRIEWVQEIVEAADRAGIPVFLKDNLLPLMGGYPIPKENIWAYRFENGVFNLRQELPERRG